MRKRIVISLAAFVIGAVATAAPFVLAGHRANLEETARKEPTMGPGITTMLGFVAAPFGGLIAAAVAWRIARPKDESEPDK